MGISGAAVVLHKLQGVCLAPAAAVVAVSFCFSLFVS